MITVSMSAVLIAGFVGGFFAGLVGYFIGRNG